MKEFLSQKGVQFEEIDIRRTPGAVETLVKLRVMATPALVIGGKVLVGFDPSEIEKALETAQ